MHLLSNAEIEFFIETNGWLNARRALAVGRQFVLFVEMEAMASLGGVEYIEIVHLGRGSFRVRLMVILRDPATATLAGLAGLALAGVGLLREDNDHSFTREVATACIDSGASRCGFRTADAEFVIERDQIAGANAGPMRDDTVTRTQMRTETRGTAEGGTSPSLGEEAQKYSAPILEVEGIFEIDDGRAYVRTVDRSYPLASGDAETPPPNQLADFQLRGPDQRYGNEYKLESWVLKGGGAIVTLVGRMIERHAGRAVTFETADRTFSPIIPDDTLGWVPLGALVEVKGFVPRDDDSTLAIFTWRELDEPKISNMPSKVEDYVDPPLDFFHDDAAPLNKDERSKNRKMTSYSGEVRSSPSGLEFAGFDGRKALIDGLVRSLSIPKDTPIEIDATVRRGSRGGMGDPRLIIWDWRPIDDIHKLSGEIFTGISGYFFHSEDGRRFKIVGRGGEEPPTAVRLVVFARLLGLPTDEPSEGSIEILHWRLASG